MTDSSSSSYTIKDDVVAALQDERRYQQRTATRWQHGGSPSLEAELLLIGHYADAARTAWVSGRGNEHALQELQRLGGVLVRCFETYGPPRELAAKRASAQ